MDCANYSAITIYKQNNFKYGGKNLKIYTRINTHFENVNCNCLSALYKTFAQKNLAL